MALLLYVRPCEHVDRVYQSSGCLNDFWPHENQRQFYNRYSQFYHSNFALSDKVLILLQMSSSYLSCQSRKTVEINIVLLTLQTQQDTTHISYSVVVCSQMYQLFEHLSPSLMMKLQILNMFQKLMDQAAQSYSAYVTAYLDDKNV